MKQKTTRSSTRPALPNSTPVILSIGHKCSTISHIGRGREPNHRGPRSQIECDLFVIGGRLRICSRLHGYRSSQCDARKAYAWSHESACTDAAVLAACSSAFFFVNLPFVLMAALAKASSSLKSARVFSISSARTSNACRPRSSRITCPLAEWDGCLNQQRRVGGGIFGEHLWDQMTPKSPGYY